MNSQSRITALIEPSALDYSMLRPRDLANLILQRSEVLTDIPRPGDVIREWEQGDATRLQHEVQSRGIIHAQRAARVIQTEFEWLKPHIDPLEPRKIADIGCGYGIFDLFAYARYGSDLLLIDIEENEKRHFGFDTEAAGYTDLETAQRFLLANGVPEGQVTTWNPEGEEELDDTVKPDLAVSFLSCGFHFPVDMYMPFFRFGVAPGGTIILDLRSGTFQEARRTLELLGRVKVLKKGGGRRRVMIRKGRG